MRDFIQWIGRRPVVILTTASVVYLALGMGQDGINLDSTTYSVIARNMIEQGRWFDPTYTAYFHPQFAEHPPLVMWAQAALFGLFGASDTTARFFGALCTLGSILAAYFLGREIKDATYGLLTGLVLLLTYNFVQIGNSTLLDVPLTFFVLLALWGMARLERDDSRTGPYIVVGLALGCAFLAKGVVSAPVWLALAFVFFFHRRRWLRSLRFWMIPVLAITMIAVYIGLDQAYAGGRFTRHYFLSQVWDRFIAGSPAIHTDWWEFTYRFITLYLPWVALLPFGIYYLFKRKVRLLYATVVTLLFYFVFYSSAAKLYYHYFCPVYALSALLAALPLAIWLRESTVKKLAVGFLFVWVAAGIAVTAAGVRIHEIRSPEIYGLTGGMNTLLKDRPSREGLFIRKGEPDWDYIAKTSWYWRSDIRLVPDLEAAFALLRGGTRYNYIMVQSKDEIPSDSLAGYGLQLYAENDKVLIYVPAREKPVG